MEAYQWSEETFRRLKKNITPKVATGNITLLKHQGGLEFGCRRVSRNDSGGLRTASSSRVRLRRILLSVTG